MKSNEMTIPGVVNPHWSQNWKSDYDVKANTLLIAEIVCRVYKIEQWLLMEKTRKRPIPECRYLVMFLRWILNENDIFENVTAFFGLDHSSLSYGINTVLSNHFTTDKIFRDRLYKIIAEIYIKPEQIEKLLYYLER